MCCKKYCRGRQEATAGQKMQTYRDFLRLNLCDRKKLLGNDHAAVMRSDGDSIECSARHLKGGKHNVEFKS